MSKKPYDSSWRRSSWPDTDARIEPLLLSGWSQERIMHYTGMARNSVQKSIARIKERLNIPKRQKGRPLTEKVREFRDWLFDASNAHADPCLKWLEIFGAQDLD